MLMRRRFNEATGSRGVHGGLHLSWLTERRRNVYRSLRNFRRYIFSETRAEGHEFIRQNRKSLIPEQFILRKSRRKTFFERVSAIIPFFAVSRNAVRHESLRFSIRWRASNYDDFFCSRFVGIDAFEKVHSVHSFGGIDFIYMRRIFADQIDLRCS